MNRIQASTMARQFRRTFGEQTLNELGKIAHFGAVTFIQRFGSALTAHLHFHICVIDGAFSQDAAGDLR